MELIGEKKKEKVSQPPSIEYPLSTTFTLSSQFLDNQRAAEHRVSGAEVEYSSPSTLIDWQVEAQR